MYLNILRDKTEEMLQFRDEKFSTCDFRISFDFLEIFLNFNNDTMGKKIRKKIYPSYKL